MERWGYAVELGLDGDENMRRDERMAEASRLDGRPRLRLYTWSPWTLSLGHHQQADPAAVEELHRRGYGIVRRPTGGRAVFHAEELTYAVAMPADSASVHETYASISCALRAGLELFGCEGIEFSRSQPDFRAHYEQEDSVSCFSASALNELTWQGRKLVGSAQRRYGSALLQHGSLLVGDAHLEIVDFLHTGVAPDRRRALRARLASRTATVRDIVGRGDVDLAELARALVAGFAAHFQAELVATSDLTLPETIAEPV